MWAGHKNYLGFTLIELMAALVVVMVLVAIALPRFRIFIARARQGEAVQNLGVIYTLQKTYMLDSQGLGGDGKPYDQLQYGYLNLPGAGVIDRCNTTDAKNNPLGFSVPKCGELRYYYTSINSCCLGQASNYGAGDRLIYPGCGESDTWFLKKLGKLDQGPNNKDDVVKKCTD